LDAPCFHSGAIRIGQTRPRSAAKTIFLFKLYAEKRQTSAV